MNRSGDGNAYNRFVNLDNIEYRIVNYLAKSKTKYANNLWKILKYDTEDCLSLPDVSYKDRMALLFRVFLTPFTDDGWDVQCSHLHIFVHSVVPQNHITSKVNIGIETIVHNKISNILGDVQNEDGNPSELDEDGNPVIIYKNRASTMLKSILADINGQMVAGIGMLQVFYDCFDVAFWCIYEFGVWLLMAQIPENEKKILEEINYYKDKYFTYDDPIPFYGLTIYPVTMRNYQQFMVSTACLYRV